MQSRRLESGGLIDRDEKLYFVFNGRLLEGFSGDSLASALLANNISLVARSIKYHRPRGILTAGLEEPSALVACRVGQQDIGPNLKATEIRLTTGLAARSQNCWPGVELDLGGLLQLGAGLLSAGFYYKTFMWPRNWWHLLYERFIRRAAGHGRVSTRPDDRIYDRRQTNCDLLIVGSGPAGLAAALVAAGSGKKIILLEQDSLAGGSTLWEQTRIQGSPAALWRRQSLNKLEDCENLRIMTDTLAWGRYDHGLVMSLENPAVGVDAISWRIRAKHILLACGATNRPLVFSGNDRPGIMLAAAVRQYIYRYAVAPGKRALLAIADADERELTRQALETAGIVVAGTLEAGEHIAATNGWRRLSGAKIVDSQGRRRRVACDLLCVSAGWSPNLQLAAQLGERLEFDTRSSALVAPEADQILSSCGACRGFAPIEECVADGERQACRALGLPHSGETAANLPVATQAEFEPGIHTPGGKAFIDLQNDVTRDDLALALREGYGHIELAKRYTSLGMGTDQGKTGWTNGILECARLGGVDARDIGHTTFRPPVSPVSIGALAGADIGQFMTPLRHTPFHREFEQRGCVFQNSGEWRYARYFPRVGESMAQAINREVLAVRNSVGCVDMSTLGKVDIKGDDAFEFLSRTYCNTLDSLEPGRLRYALMLREDGILFDDGTVAQLDHNHYLATMTTANATSVWRWINRLSQLLWPELDVQLTLTSDHWASLAIAGPRARDLLLALGPDFDCSREAFPFASVRCGKLGDELPCRVFSVSFSGESSFEINVPSGFAAELYRRVMSRGADFGITPYGLEALDLLRIEKGHVTVGAEIDGRTTPADLGLGKLVSTRKVFVGASLLRRPLLQSPYRLQLVGLTPAGGDSAIPVAAHLCDKPWRAGILQTSSGRLTASVTSPTLNQSIALALLQNGHARSGDKLWAVSPLENRSVPVVVGPSCFVDPAGERLHA